MTDRPTPANVIGQTRVDALADAGYVVVEQEHEARLVDAVQSIAYFMEQRDQATDQRDRAVRALAEALDGWTGTAGRQLLDEDWAEEVLDAEE